MDAIRLMVALRLWCMSWAVPLPLSAFVLHCLLVRFIELVDSISIPNRVLLLGTRQRVAMIVV